MKNIPLVDLSKQWITLKPELMARIERVLDKGQYILGEEVAALENEVASYCGARCGIAVGNGTDALVLMLRAFDIGPGDEVITTPFTFFATAEAIVQAGAKPVFADVDPKTFLLTAAEVEKHITSKTKAILVVHLFGQMADMYELLPLARLHKLYLFEDACQAIGATWNGYGIGTLSDAAAISFFPTKNLSTYGDGGMILVRDEERSLRLQRLRKHGSVRKYEHEEIGWNSRLDELHAAILRVKLTHLDEWTEERIKHASRYTESLQDVPISTPSAYSQNRHVYHLYTVVTEHRDALMQSLAKFGIQSGIYYTVPLHLQVALRGLGYQKGDFPVTERLCREVLSLPLFPEMKSDEQNFVIDRIRKFFAH